MTLFANTTLNLFQWLFLVAWSAIWVPSSILLMVVFFNRRIPLEMAHRLWGPGLVWAARAKLEVTGLENVDFSKPHVFVSNHESILDIPVVFTALPTHLHFVLKKELKHVPFIGWFAQATGMIFVDRKNRSQAVESLRRVGELIRGGRSVMAFPEGTRSREGQILPFKKGVFFAAAEAGVPVVPIAIAGAREVIPSDGLRVRPGSIRVAVGRPVMTIGLDAQARERLAETVRTEVVALYEAAR